MSRQKSRLTRADVDALYTARTIVMQNRDAAEAGDENARKLVSSARETIARLTAKRDNRIWL